VPAAAELLHELDAMIAEVEQLLRELRRQQGASDRPTSVRAA
jgi:hypothetical protein